MWKVIGESVIGTAHVAGAGECQDAVEAHTATAGNEGVLIFALSDGAGSAKYASEAAKLSVRKFCSTVLAQIATAPTLPEFDLLSCCEEVNRALLERASELGESPRELSATLLGGVVLRDRSWFVQIGDGAIVREKDGLYQAVTWPDAGEYVNTTVFLTSSDWRDRAQWLICDEELTEVAAFTDGLQELALRHADRSVHQPFFPSMMTQLRGAENPQSLAEPLRNFLGSKAVNERTDDDKTLLLACRVH